MAEQMHPRLAALGLVGSSLFAFLLVFNTWLGFFPAIVVKTPTGGWMKYHPLEKILSVIGMGRGKMNWSEAGTVTVQDMVQIVLLLLFVGIAWYGLRKRPEISGPVSRNMASEREAMESGELGSLPSMSGGVASPFTAQIISEVIGKAVSVDEAEVSSALGHLGVMAEANAAAEAAERPAVTSRRADLPHIDAVSFDGDDDPDDDFGDSDSSYFDGITVLGSLTEAADGAEKAAMMIENAVATSGPEAEVETSPSLPPLPGGARPASTQDRPGTSASKAEPDDTSPAKAADRTLPDVPARQSASSASPETSADGASTGSDDGGRSSTYSGAMPVRPPELPSSAEYDPESGRWLLHGAPLGDTLAPLP